MSGKYCVRLKQNNHKDVIPEPKAAGTLFGEKQLGPIDDRNS